MKSNYVGRFAPSPSGALHAGSLIAALASYLDAKAHDGKWLLRIEDVDETRSVVGADQTILQLLGQLGMVWDGEVVWQSQRKALYEAASLKLQGHIYPCACSRREIADSRLGVAQDGAPIYPGTCRNGLPEQYLGRSAHSLRLRVPTTAPENCIQFIDRWQGPQQQILPEQVGDFVLKRVDGFWAYQMAVVVDDAAQSVTDVVRGVDLLDSTARQIYLQTLLGLPSMRYLHFPVLQNELGEKLSKQTGAQAVQIGESEQARVLALQQAAQFLQLNLPISDNLMHFWRNALAAWRSQWCNHAS